MNVVDLMPNKKTSLYRTFVQHASNAVFSLKFNFKFVPVATLFSLLLIGITTAAPFYSSKILGDIIDQFTQAVTQGKPITDILHVILLYIGIDLLMNLTQSLRGFINFTFRHKLKTAYEFQNLNHRLENIDTGREEDPSFKDLEQRIHGRIWAPIGMSGMLLNGFIPNIVSFMIAIVILSKFNFYVAMIAVIAAVPKLLSKLNSDKAEYAIWNREGGRDSRFYYSLRHYALSKVHKGEQQMFGAKDFLLGKIKAMYNKFEVLIFKGRQKRIVYDFTLDFVGLIALGASMLLITQDVFAGLFQVGTLVFLFQTYRSLESALEQTLDLSASALEESRYVTDIQTWFKVRPVVTTPNPVLEVPNSNNLNIEVKNLTFHYPHDKKIVLKNINFSIKQGEKIGIVGSNGSGKSTMIKLLSRIYDPTEGDIFVNGVNLNQIPQEIWFKNLTALFQNYGTYEYTIKEAIGVSAPDQSITDQDILDASEKSTANWFIEKLPKQYDEQIGAEFEGIEPSGGQRQKLALARTFLRKAPIMILDEPTAAIDTQSELSIYKTLDEMTGDQTVIFISHDFSTIRRADRVLVFEGGEIIEEGTHDELMSKNGSYANLYNRQKEAYE